MGRNKKNILIFLLCLVTGFGSFAFGGCGNNSGAKEQYIVTYMPNYEGAETRKVSVQAGATASSWRINRDDYKLVEWCTDASGSKAFDFTKKINSDQTLYAKWTEKPGIATVNFAFECKSANDKMISIEKESLISTKQVPKHERLGMNFTGWYSDAARTQKWNFDTDKVADNITLYAGYEEKPNYIERDENGNIEYEDITVQVWNRFDWMYSMTKMQKLADDFSAEHQGITVNISKELPEQAPVMLRLDQTPELLVNSVNYYSIADVFDIAGIEYSNSDFYEGAIKECTMNGALIQLPIAGVAPYIIYDKTLMTKYNGSKPLPTNYTELSALLKAAYLGESGANNKFVSIATTESWSFKEAPSYMSFMQNGADYFRYANGKNYNNWNEPDVNVKATTALQNLYDLFGPSGANHGSINFTNDVNAIEAVIGGNALMAMVTWREQIGKFISNDNIGIMPMSGLFTDDTGAESKRIPMHTAGFAFSKFATAVSPIEMSAAALFADYVVKHAYVFAEDGFIPLHKEATANDNYAKSNNAVIKLLKQIGDPENFATFDGNKYLKPIVNTIAAEGHIMPFLKGDGTDLQKVLKDLRVEIASRVY